MYYIIATLMLQYALVTDGLNNGLARTPPMGWLQWERFRCITDCDTYPNDCVSESLFKRTADRLVKDGYSKVGYKSVNIDDCWSEMERDDDGNLVADKKRFPGGIKVLADYTHERGLNLGIYTDFGTKTCGRYPGSIFHMEKDTKLFADWGIDMIKVDGCYSCSSLYEEGYKQFGWYMNHTDRPMLYSCSWPAYLEDKGKPYKEIAKYCNIWRNWADITDSWDSVLSIINYNAKYQDEIVPYVGPGNFNDIDMLLIGNFGLSKDQSKTQMAIWSILAAPLFISADLDKMQDWQKEILLNEEIISVNQDKLGIMGKQVYKDDNGQQTWLKKLSKQCYAVAIMSTRTDIPIMMGFTLSDLKVSGPMNVRCLFAKKDIGVISKSFQALVNPSGVVMLKLCPLKRKHSKHSSKRNYTPHSHNVTRQVTHYEWD